MKDKYEYKVDFTEDYLKSSDYKALEIGLQKIMDDMYHQEVIKHKPSVTVKVIDGAFQARINLLVNLKKGYIDY